MTGTVLDKELAALVIAADLAAIAARVSEQRDAKLENAITAARDAGATWTEIASRIGVSEGQARWAVQKRHTPEAAARLEGQAPRTGPRPGRGPGVSISEASRKLGISRRTVTVWAKSGKLQSAVNELGQTRILLEGPLDDTSENLSVDTIEAESRAVPEPAI
jgi:transposase-like protein